MLWIRARTQAPALAAGAGRAALAGAVAGGCWRASGVLLGSRKRPRAALLLGASGAWALAYLAVLAEPLVSAHGGCAALISLLVLRWSLRPAAGQSGHTYEQHDAARFMVQRYGEDALPWFILRPDKSLHLGGDGVLAYTVIGDTAVVSGDPVGPRGAAAAVLETEGQHPGASPPASSAAPSASQRSRTGVIGAQADPVGR